MNEVVVENTEAGGVILTVDGNTWAIDHIVDEVRDGIYADAFRVLKECTGAPLSRDDVERIRIELGGAPFQSVPTIKRVDE